MKNVNAVNTIFIVVRHDDVRFAHKMCNNACAESYKNADVCFLQLFHNHVRQLSQKCNKITNDYKACGKYVPCQKYF